MLQFLGIGLVSVVGTSLALSGFAFGDTLSTICGGVPARAVSVMRCYDGDTSTLSDKTKVRLAGIDAPEAKGTMGGKGQQGSDVAAAALRERLVGKPGVTMSVHDQDQYGRTVGEFCIDGKSVNVEMLPEGLATVYRGKVKTKTIDKPALEGAEESAKAERKGLCLGISKAFSVSERSSQAVSVAPTGFDIWLIDPQK